MQIFTLRIKNLKNLSLNFQVVSGLKNAKNALTTKTMIRINKMNILSPMTKKNANSEAII